MPLQIIRNDITKLTCDAIVNAANTSLLGGGGVDGAIHKAAGPGLLQECKKLGGCGVGEAKITRGYRLPCKYVIHTVGPVWKDGRGGEEEQLVSCYGESLRLALEYGCESVAFPLIASGHFGYPKDKALKAAVNTITAFLLDHDMTVYIVVFDASSFKISGKLYTDIASFIDDRYVETHFEARSSQRILYESEALPGAWQDFGQPSFAGMAQEAAAPPAKEQSLEDALRQVDESFSQMLLRKIDEKGMTDSQCYKKANVDRKLFSKIRGDIHYHPSKQTAIAFAVALELSLAETRDLLMKAGFALSHSSKFDIIIEYFITHGNYNVFEINEALFAFDQSLLGM